MNPTRISSRTRMNRSWFIFVLLCALLFCQFALNKHVTEHTASVSIAVTSVDHASDEHQDFACLLCLEHQVHGTSMISNALLVVAQTVHRFEFTALPPNSPYLSPERASQRAPPLFSSLK